RAMVDSPGRVFWPARDEDALRSLRKAPARTLYHCLVNLDAFEDVRARAAEIVSDAFAGSAQRAGPPWIARFDYDSDGLERRLFEIARTRALERRTLEAKSMPDIEIRTLLHELAPTALIEGSLLERASNASNAHTPVGALLLRLYLDAIGHGVSSRHHGNL